MPRQARDKSTQAPRKTATTNCRFSRARTHTHAQVGGRVSVSCSVGALPMALHFGYGAVEEFHTGLRQMDEHVLTAPLRENIPALMGTDGLKPKPKPKRCLRFFLTFLARSSVASTAFEYVPRQARDRHTTQGKRNNKTKKRRLLRRSARCLEHKLPRSQRPRRPALLPSLGAVRNHAFFAPLIYTNDHSAKTGSGHT
jgi:hypothetical protein